MLSAETFTQRDAMGGTPGVRRGATSVVHACEPSESAPPSPFMAASTRSGRDSSKAVGQATANPDRDAGPHPARKE
jgi:hypothetical protein